jgi:acyl carrier protein
MCEGSIFVQNDYICITQFDRILKNKTHFNFKIDGEKWIHYAKSMSEIYNDIVEENFTIIEKEKWKNSKPQKLTQIMPYISSVAFHYGDNNFWGFKDVEGDKDVEKKWSLDQNQYRTSLGVVELVSNILRRYNIKLPLPSLTDDNVAKEYNEFIKRFYDNYN